mgnify:CR=1 FL=1
MELISPTTLVVSVKDDGGDAISAAKTVDGGVAFVRWDPTGKSWFIDKDLTMRDYLNEIIEMEKIYFSENLILLLAQKLLNIFLNLMKNLTRLIVC